MSQDEGLRAWAWKDGWTHGRAVGFIRSSIFYKDETGKLNPPREVVFFQDWETPDPSFWRSTWEADVDHEDTEAERYDRRNVVGRYWWIRWAAGVGDFPNARGGAPPVGKRLLAFIRALGEEYDGVGTTGLPSCPWVRRKLSPAPWRSVLQDGQIEEQEQEKEPNDPEAAPPDPASGSWEPQTGPEWRDGQELHVIRVHGKGRDGRVYEAVHGVLFPEDVYDQKPRIVERNRSADGVVIKVAVDAFAPDGKLFGFTFDALFPEGTLVRKVTSERFAKPGAKEWSPRGMEAAAMDPRVKKQT